MKDWFCGYLILDASIGNTDRHHDNWGALRAEADLILAPSFDHASSFGFLLSDEERIRLLEEDRVEAWADRATTPFADRPHPCNVALEALEDVSLPVAEHWFERLRGALAGGEAAIGSVPTDRMSEPSKGFAMRLLRHNTQRIVSEGEARISA